ncbi:double-stranded RNA-binding protein 1-like protein [Tanacetum coccineum]|uniref:Double-stranded RNA-binding protein 1-like protein n=1 Tax=Tanacetum coccineum TaxID=301880 RepID=A0ABQ5ET47_9ASTR
MSIKKKLYELCVMKDWTIPVYSSVKEGQDHIPVFHGLVEVNGKKFRSLTHFQNSKAAQNDAAEIAFSILSRETSNISSLPTVSEETCIPRGLVVPILNEPRQVSLMVYTSIPNEALPSGNVELLPVAEGKWTIRDPAAKPSGGGQHSGGEKTDICYARWSWWSDLGFSWWSQSDLEVSIGGDGGGNGNGLLCFGLSKDQLLVLWVYFLWQERNLRFFQAKSRSVDDVCELIRENDRLEAAEIWKFHVFQSAQIWKFHVLHKLL